MTLPDCARLADLSEESFPRNQPTPEALGAFQVLGECSATHRQVGHSNMSVPANGSPTRNPTQSACPVSAMRLLDHVQRRRGLDCSVRSLTERRGDADLCDEDERKHAAGRRQ
jgi:hypothetical protein